MFLVSQIFELTRCAIFLIERKFDKLSTEFALTKVLLSVISKKLAHRVS